MTHHSVRHSAPPEHGGDTTKRRQELERIHFSAVNKFSQMFVRMVGQRDPAASEVAGRRRTDGMCQVDSGMDRKLLCPKHVFHSASSSGMCPRVNAGTPDARGGPFVLEASSLAAQSYLI